MGAGHLNGAVANILQFECPYDVILGPLHQMEEVLSDYRDETPEKMKENGQSFDTATALKREQIETDHTTSIVVYPGSWRCQYSVNISCVMYGTPIRGQN